MSNAHRPTWAPAVGRESKMGSSAFFQVDYSARTKLKFRAPGQGASTDIAKRDLKTELLRAEREAQNKKRKAQGLPLLPEVRLAIEGEKEVKSEAGEGESKSGLVEEDGEDEAARKRRKILEEVAAMDADDSDDDDESDEENNDDEGKIRKDKGKGKAVENGGGETPVGEENEEENDDDDSDDDSSDDDEDETAALMAELTKIKRERQEEKERQEREAAEANAVDREAEIALGNPLLNLQAALGRSPSTSSSVAGSSVTGSFAVKRRWDDDLIFKNQAAGVDEKPKKEFVNDLLRTEFHRKFLGKFMR